MPKTFHEEIDETIANLLTWMTRALLSVLS